MSLKADVNDYYFSEFDDIYFYHNDVLDTFTFGDAVGDYGISLKQEIKTRIKAYLDDWKLYPTVGASLRDYIGTIADMEYVKNQAQIAIHRCLVRDGLVDPNGIDILPIRISAQTLMFVLTIKLPIGDMVMGLTYDFTDDLFRTIDTQG